MREGYKETFDIMRYCVKKLFAKPGIVDRRKIKLKVSLINSKHIRHDALEHTLDLVNIFNIIGNY